MYDLDDVVQMYIQYCLVWLSLTSARNVILIYKIIFNNTYDIVFKISWDAAKSAQNISAINAAAEPKADVEKGWVLSYFCKDTRDI